jgi:hypothetical protein
MGQYIVIILYTHTNILIYAYIHLMLVVIDFMFRHGILDVTEPDYREIQQRLHRRLVLDDYNYH